MLTKDALVEIALNLSYDDVLKLCQTSTTMNQYICENKYFWLNKIKRDYPKANIYTNTLEGYKKLYIRLSTMKLPVLVEFRAPDFSKKRKFLFTFPDWIEDEALGGIFERGFENYLNANEIEPENFSVILDSEIQCENETEINSYCWKRLSKDTRVMEIFIDIDIDIFENKFGDLQVYLSKSVKDYIES